MSISPGSRIGPYDVIAPLGEGGMGVVFRGRDSRLQRDVALKLLPDNLASDPDRLSRFEREAQMLASLNHANIAQIYGLEQVNSSTCIVMELVDGETLADRLKKGPLSNEEALDCCRQIADALSTAHERGIVHRDLKPANIKLTPNGTVKVLDFGLAKALGPKGSDISLTDMPTLATGSIVGSIVGTPGYMSPEQARGKEVDARTDIWAFGCVLYEMLTARQAFEGETVTDVMAKIVTSSPDLDLLPKDTPASIRLLLSATLNKSASQRLQHIGDIRLFLDGSLVPASMKEAAPATKGIRGKLLAAALVIAIVMAAFLGALYFRKAPAPADVMKFEMTFPNLTGTPLLSPDGKLISYGGDIGEGKRGLFIRPIDSDIPRQLAGTDGVNGAWWSADSKRLSFIDKGKLKVYDLAAGSARIVGDLDSVRFSGGTWNLAGDLLVASTKPNENVILKISESGGPVVPVTKLDPSRSELIHLAPVFLPDGKSFVYVATGGTPQQAGVFLTSLDALSGNEAPKHVLPFEVNRFSGMAYVAPYLLIHNLGSLTAYRMDTSWRIESEPIVIAEDVDGTLSASNNGLLLFHKAAPAVGEQLVWHDHMGRIDGGVGAAGNYGNVDISPKGDRVAVDLTTNGNRDVWVIDLARDVPSRITVDPAPEWSTAWSPDGERLAFVSNRGNINQIYEKASTGNGTETLVPTEGAPAIPVNWSPNNDYIVFSRLRNSSAGGYDTWLLPLTGDRKPKPFLESQFDKFHARVSPNGRYIAFATNETGTYQVVVHTFPDPSGGKWTISAEGGVEPKWSRNGRELYYLAFDGKLMSVAIAGPNFSAGRPTPLFQTRLSVNPGSPSRDRRYDVAPDGRFLMNTPGERAAFAPFTIVVNWMKSIRN
jgi:eukaryotic-like serine/threonine-protein kinase